MGRHGHRNMFYATGLPGWMRFGYSPGWGGTPPGVQYLQQTGQLPQAEDWFEKRASAQISQSTQSAQAPPASKPAYTPTAPVSQGAQAPQVPREQKIRMLENQVEAIESQIRQIRDGIEQIKK